MLKLYHYIHCPFCVRVRLTLGFLNIPYESTVLRYDDEKTPVDLSGKKMLPILAINQNQVMNESLDIMVYLDSQNSLKISDGLKSDEFKELNTYLDQLGGPLHSLVMPFWVYTPEFDEKSRNYFVKKKEVKRGPFVNLFKQRFTLMKEVETQLEWVEKRLKPFYRSSTFGFLDILIASHLWGLYVVPEFQFSPKLHQYLQTIKELCRFDYQGDFCQKVPGTF